MMIYHLKYKRYIMKFREPSKLEKIILIITTILGIIAIINALINGN